MSSSAIRRAPPANPLTATGVFPLTSNPLLACSLSAPGKLVLEGKKFRVRAEGNVLTAVGTTTVKPQLLVGLVIPASPLVIGSWTALAAGAAVAVPTTGCPWFTEADLIFDSVSGLMHGTSDQLVNNTFAALAAITGVLTGINSTNLPVVQAGPVTVQPADPVMQFAIGITYSAAGANSCNLTNFEIAF
jgi:hypothetical protein